MGRTVFWSRAYNRCGSKEPADGSESFRVGFDQDGAKRIGQAPDCRASAECGQDDQEPEPRSLSRTGGLEQLVRFRIQLADFHLEIGAEWVCGL
jgi:hypothetical protein